MNKLTTNEPISEFEQKLQLVITKLYSTLVSKNKDYGNSYEKSVEKYGKVVPLIRLSDKLNRLENLILSDEIPNVLESEEETLEDLAGYAVLELIGRTILPDEPKEHKKPRYADLDD